MITPNLRVPDTLARPDRWRDQAECAKPYVDPEEMFPKMANALGAREARDICRRCPVAVECLVSIMRIEAGSRSCRSGVFAGTSTQQRQRLYQELQRTGEPLRPAVQRLVARVLARPRTLRSVFEERTLPGPDGHVAWTARRLQVRFQDRSYTAMQMAFILGHGREPQGTIRAACGRIGCVAWRHLADEPMRRGRTTGAHQHTTKGAPS
ncbi:WhiB family transcriptional regulator [Streptomyces sp. NPDC006208]|uniref:WhiB family transcriptional regulator n=1 Tax=Streptomyces sp. NPDC006208 TaxID=3156734 RepID=UPI0033A4977C